MKEFELDSFYDLSFEYTIKESLEQLLELKTKNPESDEWDDCILDLREYIERFGENNYFSWSMENELKDFCGIVIHSDSEVLYILNYA